jgi:prepilin-type N-terminal cleavage/methylation domain-containing protein/prepilin-type processing-associated H-X9-DG protein
MPLRGLDELSPPIAPGVPHRSISPGVRVTSFQRKTRGFTLIELLVVVAIIGMLIAILLPALSRAREQSKATICMSNMRQVGLGFYYYGEDHGGHPPPNRLRSSSDAPYGGTPPEYRDSDWWYYAHMVPNYVPSNERSQTNAAFSGVFRCPSDPDAGRAYSMNIFASDYETTRPFATPYTRGTPFSPSKVEHAERYILLGEAHAIFRDDLNPGLYGTRYIIGQEGSSVYRKFKKVEEYADPDRGRFYGYIDFSKHRDSANFLLADLHVESFTQSQIVEPDPENPGRWISTLKVQWSPDDPTFNLPTPP